VVSRGKTARGSSPEISPLGAAVPASARRRALPTGGSAATASHGRSCHAFGCPFLRGLAASIKLSIGRRAERSRSVASRLAAFLGHLSNYVSVTSCGLAVRPEALMQHVPRPESLPPGIDPPRSISVTFVQATVFDTPRSTAGQPGIPRLVAVIAVARARAAAGQFEDPSGRRALFQAGAVCRRRRSSSSSRRRLPLGSRRDRKDRVYDPDWMVGVKLGGDNNGCYWLLDMVRGRANLGGFDKLLLDTVRRGVRCHRIPPKPFASLAPWNGSPRRKNRA